ncbi:hypothetical protein HOY82DRAFT_52771 [Tuber indicum]|nr:hypothetical protein HOY82DRAFT_52771 [Tuber indicum]
MIFFPFFLSRHGWVGTGWDFLTKIKISKRERLARAYFAKDGKGRKNVTMYFAICLFPMIFFHFLVLSLAISRGVFFHLFSFFPFKFANRSVLYFVRKSLHKRYGGLWSCRRMDIGNEGHAFFSFRSLS